MRVVHDFDARGFSNRATGQSLGPPDQAIDFAAGLRAMTPWLDRGKGKIRFAKVAKLFADGAMSSQLMQMNALGYIDGHHGEWLMAPPVMQAGVLALWNPSYTVHVHVNDDAGMDAVLDALETARQHKPRFDHRVHAHHIGFHAQVQTMRLAALGADASVNPYYIHALADDYSGFGLGPERASQITRCGSMPGTGMKVSFHSDFMMAPTEPLTLAVLTAAKVPMPRRSEIDYYWPLARVAYGLQHVRLHDIRHSSATEMVNAGVDLATVGKVLGHKSHASTMRYAHHSTAQQAVAVGKIGRKSPHR